MPHLELQQDPETQRVVRVSRVVLPDDALNLGWPGVAALARAGVQQHLGRQLAELLAEPAREGDTEAHLGPVEYLVGKNTPQRRLEQALAGDSTQLLGRRQ